MITAMMGFGLVNTAVLCCFVGILASAVEIHVDPGSEGHDSENCWEMETLYPCKTLKFALRGAQGNDNVQIVLHGGTYSLVNGKETTFSEMSRLSINSTKPATIKCEENAGLSFFNSTNISIENVVFAECGAVHNSSSRDLDPSTDPEFIQFKAALYFLFCENVSMKNVQVTRSFGTGVVLYSVVGKNTFQDSIFSNNQVDNLYSGGGGGLTIDFSFCVPGDLECLENETYTNRIPDKYRNGANFLIENCTFLNNTATTHNYTYDLFVATYHSYHVALGRGGGLSVFFGGIAFNNYVLVESSYFVNNSAVWGGGAIISYQDSSVNNTVLIKSSEFTRNICPYDAFKYQGTGGGALRLRYTGLSDFNNSFTAENTTFTSNSAYFGGGISFQSISESLDDQPTFNKVKLYNCSWIANVARLGSAFDLSVYFYRTNGTIFRPVIRDARFEKNSVAYADRPGVTTGLGTVYTASVPLQLQGTIYCTENFGSAIVSLDAGLHLAKKTILNMYHNVGTNGGGITLFGSAFLEVSDESSLIFRDNLVDLNGGGIYWESIGNHELVSSRNCFIRYADVLRNPVDWTALFVFSNNSAGISGSAIYATTLLACLWGGLPFGSVVDPVDGYKDIFCWKGSDGRIIWDYKDQNCSSSVATAPGYFTGFTEGNHYKLQTIAGNFSRVPITMNDDRYNEVPLESLVFSKVNDAVASYITHEPVPFFGRERENMTIKISTIKPRVLSTELLLSFKPCPPGFFLNDTSLRCEGGKYPFVFPRDNFTATIQRGNWFGYGNNGSLFEAQCFFCPLNPELPIYNYVTLPQDPNDLNEFFCGPLNREGVVCGSCIDGYGPAVNSEQFTCINCTTTHYAWLLYLTTEYLPITILLVVVVVFNLNFLSGPANAFVFFAQIITTTFGVDGNGIIVYRAITSHASRIKSAFTAIYGIWNLDFFENIEGWEYCLSPNLSALDLLGLQYLTAFYPLVIIAFAAVILALYDKNYRFVVWIVRPIHRLSSRIYSRWNLHNSIIEALATFLVLSYSKFVIISARLFFAETLYNEYGDPVSEVSHLDGVSEFHSIEYAPFLVTASVVYSLCLLMPIILLLYSLRPFYWLLTKCNATFLQPGGKFQYFLNSFHHCYKDGTNGTHDCRYFAALYFVFRVLLMATYSASTWMEQYVLQQIICTGCILLFAIIRPYKNPYYNLIDTAMFSILAIINVLVMYNLYLEAANLQLSASAYYCLCILIFIPLLYIVCYVFYYFCKTHQAARLERIVNKLRRRKETNSDRDFNDFINAIDGDRDCNRYYGPVKPDATDKYAKGENEEAFPTIDYVKVKKEDCPNEENSSQL